MGKEDSINVLKSDYPDIYEGVAAMNQQAIQASQQMISETLRKQEFYKALNYAYPNWQSILATPEFQKYAQEIHTYSGLPIYVWLKNGFGRFDSKKVIQIFDIFFKRKTASPKRTQPAMSVEEAKRAFVKLADDKIRKKISEADFKKREAELRKIILGV